MRTHSYPAWFYGPNGAAEVFQDEQAVPEGWKDHPSKAGEDAPAPDETGAAPVPEALSPVTASPEAGDAVDAAGWPFDETLHAATRSQTKDGLWRMKVGVSRPAPKPGFPKPVLDL